MPRRSFSSPLLVLAAGLVFLPVNAARATTISLVWSSTSGAGVGVGTSTLTGMSVGDTATLDVRVTVDSAGLSSAGMSVAWHPLVFSAIDFEVCPAGLGNPLGAGFCGSSPDPLLPLGSPFINDGLGVVRGIEAAGSGGGQADTTFTLARISLVKLPASETGFGGSSFEAYFFPDEEMLDSSGAPISPDALGAYAGFTGGHPWGPIVPEPSSALLLAVGLAGLGSARRRKRSLRTGWPTGRGRRR